MRAMTKAVAIAAVHVALVCSLGLKLLHDRQSCPQAWFKTHHYDPNLPIRGRYLSLQVEVADPRPASETTSRYRDEIQAQEQAQPHWAINFGRECGSITVRASVPVASFDSRSAGDCDNLSFSRQRSRDGSATVLLVGEPVIFFVPDTAELPGTRNGTELWVLATIPHKGPPRAIALGIKKAGEGRIERLKLD